MSIKRVSMTFDVFENLKAFNTKYHEGTKDKKIEISKTNLTQNVCCATNTVPLLKQYRQNRKQKQVI
jgi:hypothetical protein